MIVVIGKVPPPIGGVTIYVSRLIENLTGESQNHSFLSLNISNLIKSNYKLKGFSIVHLICSHPVIRFYYSILCKILNKKLIITYTDNIGEFSNPLFNWLNIQSIAFASIPIVFNINSFKIGLKINQRTKLVSSFIPPLTNDSNIDNIKEYFERFLNDYKTIFCTNAFRFEFDKNGQELYGIIPLISIFNTIPHFGLIISDPSGTYNEYFIKNKISLGPNIKLLVFNKFSFIDVIEISDCLIRSTTTDGDSLSIKEALHLNKDVICSDCVNRPSSVLKYPTNNKESLYNLILNYSPSEIKNSETITNGFEQIMEIYKDLMN